MSGAEHPRIRPVTMPKWGIEMQEGTITGWSVEPGRSVAKGDALLDVETEKIVNAVESPAGGVLRRVLAAVGETLPVGALIAVLADPGVDDAAIDAFVRDFRPVDASFDHEGGTSLDTNAAPATPAGPPPMAPVAGSAAEAGGEARVSPIARRVAEKLGVDLSKVTGTGRNGRISKEDVEAYAARVQSGATGPASPPRSAVGPADAAAPGTSVAAEPASRERLTSMRATIARRLGESKRDIPHYRLVAELDVDGLVAHRRALVAAGRQVSVNDLLLVAVARSLARHSRLNAQYVGEELLQFGTVDLAVAVATPGGLVTPIVHGAESLPVERLAATVRDLAERARTGKLAREEITGGTFTVSNLGMHGVRQFDAIINPPQVAILAVGAVEPRPVVRDGALAVGQRCTVTLSCDHRVVDGAVAGEFLATLGGDVARTGATS